jgi:ectoine hydroxylase
MMMSPLTDEQYQQFHRDGYLIEKQLFSREEMQLLLKIGRADLTMLRNAYDKVDATGSSTQLSMRNELTEDDIYSTIVCSRRLVDRLACLMNDEVYHWHHKMMLKEPRVGGAWEWHQDYGYWYRNNNVLYPDMASACIAIDPATQANGCLQLIQGSHKMGRIDHDITGTQIGADLNLVEAALNHPDMTLVYAELDPGDVLFFHANTLHRSDANTSEHPRWSLICCYNTKHHSPYKMHSGHPEYAPLNVVDDQSVLEVGNKHWQALEVVAS